MCMCEHGLSLLTKLGQADLLMSHKLVWHSESLELPLGAGTLPQAQPVPLLWSWNLTRDLVAMMSQMWHWELWGLQMLCPQLTSASLISPAADTAAGKLNQGLLQP